MSHGWVVESDGGLEQGALLHSHTLLSLLLSYLALIIAIPCSHYCSLASSKGAQPPRCVSSPSLSCLFAVVSCLSALLSCPFAFSVSFLPSLSLLVVSPNPNQPKPLTLNR
jgi:hypothetical protein